MRPIRTSDGCLLLTSMLVFRAIIRGLGRVALRRGRYLVVRRGCALEALDELVLEALGAQAPSTQLFLEV